MRAWLFMLALVASCEGRCRTIDAVTDEVPGGVCAAGQDAELALCVRGSEVFTCAVQGNLFRPSCRRGRSSHV